MKVYLWREGVGKRVLVLIPVSELFDEYYNYLYLRLYSDIKLGKYLSKALYLTAGKPTTQNEYYVIKHRTIINILNIEKITFTTLETPDSFLLQLDNAVKEKRLVIMSKNYLDNILNQLPSVLRPYIIKRLWRWRTYYVIKKHRVRDFENFFRNTLLLTNLIEKIKKKGVINVRELPENERKVLRLKTSNLILEECGIKTVKFYGQRVLYFKEDSLFKYLDNLVEKRKISSQSLRENIPLAIYEKYVEYKQRRKC